MCDPVRARASHRKSSQVDARLIAAEFLNCFVELQHDEILHVAFDP
jgi:hypothetical protein